MDGSRFDDFARAFVTSRRGALKTLLGGAVAGVAAVLAPDETRAAAVVAAQAVGERRNPLRRAGKRCIVGLPCGRLAPCTDGYCTPIVCSIDGTTIRRGRAQPGQSLPGLRADEGLVDSMGERRGRDGVRERGRDPCLEVAGECIFGDCVRDMVPNGTECGPESGAAVAAPAAIQGEGCGVFGCEEVTSGCLILGNPYDDGVTNPGNLCELCDPSRNVGTWTDKNDNAPCGDIDGSAAGGTAAAPANAATPPAPAWTAPSLHDRRSTTTPTATPTRAIPARCATRRAARTPWSNASTETRCGDNRDECCNGAGSCDICDPDCVIDGKGYRTDATAPGGCAICDPSRSTGLLDLSRMITQPAVISVTGSAATVSAAIRSRAATKTACARHWGLSPVPPAGSTASATSTAMSTRTAVPGL